MECASNRQKATFNALLPFILLDDIPSFRFVVVVPSRRDVRRFERWGGVGVPLDDREDADAWRRFLAFIGAFGVRHVEGARRGRIAR